ncbi:MAG: peptidylprolyl isomerase [Anaerolineales bacterium]
MAEKQQKPRIVTRKHLIGLERERFLNRLLLIGTGVIVVLIVLLVGWNPLLQTFVYPNQTVAEVEGEKISGSKFIARARYFRQQLMNQFEQTYQEYQNLSQIFGDDPNFTSQYETYLLQIQAQLEPQTLGQVVIDQLVNERLLKLEADKLGIAISEEQIDRELEKFLGYFPNGTPTPVIDPTTAATSTLSAAQYALVSATPTKTTTPTPSVTPLVSATTQNTPVPTLEAPTPTVIISSPTPSPTATAYTLEGYQQLLADVYSFYEKLQVNEQVIRDVIEAGVLGEAMKDHITADLPRTQEQVWARHILVATQEEALAVLGRLEAGEDWAALAAELSTDESNKAFGGDLGWFPKEQMVEPFANAAFTLRIGEVSEPVQSDFGWHVIQALGHEDRPLSQAEYDQLRNQAFADFVLALREQYAVQIFESWKAMTPSTP